MIKIGDEFETESYGSCKVVDIYISPTTQERVYKIVNTGKEQDGLINCEYFVQGAELT